MKNIDKWSAKRFTRDKKGRIIGTYNHKIIGNAYEPIIRKYANGRLLDLGCGDVPFYLFYKDIISENICVDWGNSSLDISYLDFEADLNKPLPMLETNSFDSVLCTDVLEHIHSPELLVNEISRVMKPGGVLILTVPFLYWIHEAPHDYHRYSKYKLHKFCEDNEFDVIKLEEYGGLPEILFDLAYKGVNYYNLPLKGWITSLMLFIGYGLARFNFVRRMSASSRSTFPLGYVLVARKN